GLQRGAGKSPVDWNLRDQTWQVQYEYTRNPKSAGGASAAGLDQWPNGGGLSGVFWPRQLPPPQRIASRDENDGILFFRPVDAVPDRAAAVPDDKKSSIGPGPVFLNLVGNVAEFVCDAPEAFEAAEQTVDRPPAGLRSYEGA